jgi:hypothetical protein
MNADKNKQIILSYETRRWFVLSGSAFIRVAPRLNFLDASIASVYLRSNSHVVSCFCEKLNDGNHRSICNTRLDHPGLP